MKILLSAFACEPQIGSEPEIGWAWAKRAASIADEIHVITRNNSRATIEKEGHESNIFFHYYDLPLLFLLLEKKCRLIYLYYHCWQFGAAIYARKLHKKQRFDLVQHVTYGTALVPSFMWILRIPFVWGPLAGADRMPSALFKLSVLGIWGYLYETVRLIRIFLSKLNPFLWVTMALADSIIVVTNDNLSYIPAGFRHKTLVIPAVGYKALDKNCRADAVKKNLIFVGRLIPYKGIRILIKVMKQLKTIDPSTRLLVIGDGREATFLKKSIRKSDLHDCILLAGKKPRYLVYEYLQNSFCLLFPSTRDSGGYVVLEAIAAGCPVICLDCGGPGAMITARGLSEKVRISASTEHAVTEIVGAIGRLMQNKNCSVDPRQEIDATFFEEFQKREITRIYRSVARQGGPVFSGRRDTAEGTTAEPC